jgi:hypothetical protein
MRNSYRGKQIIFKVGDKIIANSGDAIILESDLDQKGLGSYKIQYVDGNKRKSTVRAVNVCFSEDDYVDYVIKVRRNEKLNNR